MVVGFIGLGNMGLPMARNVLKSGFELLVHDLRHAAAEPLTSLGARWADSPREIAQQVDTVITSLPGPPQVESVAFGQDGLLSGLRPGTTWIEMSTSSPDLLAHLADEAGKIGVTILDAPVTGAVDGAQAGTLTIFAGGPAEALERQRPLLESMGRQIFHTGPAGTGLAAKLLTNLLWFVNAAAIGEALILGAKAGIELTDLWEIIKSSAGNSWVAEHDVPAIFQGHYDPSFTLDLCCKDLRLINELGRSLDVPLELGSLAAHLFHRAQVQYGGEKGEMHVVKLLEDFTGTNLQVDV
jgi:3-hydroxyisobutyrate dehydrogenase